MALVNNAARKTFDQLVIVLFARRSKLSYETELSSRIIQLLSPVPKAFGVDAGDRGWRPAGPGRAMLGAPKETFGGPRLCEALRGAIPSGFESIPAA